MESLLERTVSGESPETLRKLAEILVFDAVYCNISWYSTAVGIECQRRILNPVEHIQWSFLAKLVNDF